MCGPPILHRQPEGLRGLARFSENSRLLDQKRALSRDEDPLVADEGGPGIVGKGSDFTGAEATRRPRVLSYEREDLSKLLGNQGDRIHDGVPWDDLDLQPRDSRL